MSVKLEENSYKKLREYDSSWQAMTRMTDINNIYDIRQEFTKNSIRNDFAIELERWNNNRGYLNNGLYIDKQDFFSENSSTNVGKPIKYFKFKANFVLNPKQDTKISEKTYIDKIHYSNIFDLKETTVGGKPSYSFGDKITIESNLNSYPLQRNDKLNINELSSIFLYLNGIKIPDNEIFIYPGRSWSDIFIPMSYIGPLESEDFYTKCIFTIDVRRAGTEDFYYRNRAQLGSTITIDMSDEEYSYTTHSINNIKFKKENFVLFVDGKISKIKDFTKEGNILTVNLDQTLNGNNIELYILNDIIHRYSVPEESMLNSTGSKVHFYLNDNYYADIISGPITKQSVSFWYDGVRIDDSKIHQTSRFSFEYEIDQYDYYEVYNSTTSKPSDKITYFIKLKDGTYSEADVSKGFNKDTIYYTRRARDTFDEKKIDFFIEDTNYLVDELLFKIYGDDYYLLNMLGVRRCVDKMKGNKSYSIFDEDRYSISFKDVLSKGSTQFDVQKTQEFYDNLEKTYHSDETRIIEMIKKNPSITREFFDQFKRKFKKFVVYGNEEDLHTSSVEPISDEANIYYKIYVNHNLLSTESYTTERSDGYDLITVDKSVLDPLKYDSEGKIIKGLNRIEIYQYDLSYIEKIVFMDTINDSFNKETIDGEEVYTKTYKIEDLPFGNEFINDDLVAIEKIDKRWYRPTNDEYYLVYPDNKDPYGYICTPIFKIINRTETELKIKINLKNFVNNKGQFLILSKEFNTIKQITITNNDDTYFNENDLVFPIYSASKVYTLDEYGNQVLKEVLDHIPYINNSEPFLTKNGKELVQGKDYTYITPERNNSIACSFLVMKSSLKRDDNIALQFNSAKTNILILGYTELDIDNKYGLIYLSELKYPVSPEYMNIFVNGEKISSMDIDILSDKLIRVRNIYRPIFSIIVTTNLMYKESEISEYINAYKPSKFELLLEEIFTNCDPSKTKSSDTPSIDYVYKVEPDDPNYDINHGFIEDVDSIKQAENPLWGEESDDTYNSDTMIIMYINWLNNSRKTRSYGFKDKDINPIVLKYFSIYTNTVIDNRLDMIIDSSKYYDGVLPNIQSDPIQYKVDEENNTLTKKYQYPGAQIDLRRRFFYSMLVNVLEKHGEEGTRVGFNEENLQDELVQDLCEHDGAKLLYPNDFNLEPDENGIRWTGSNTDIPIN